MRATRGCAPFLGGECSRKYVVQSGEAMQHEAQFEISFLSRLENCLASLSPSIEMMSASPFVEGMAPKWVLYPEDESALCEAMSVLHANRIPSLVAGNATRLTQGNLLRGDAVLLSTTRLAQLHVFEPEEGVVQAGAGMRVAELQEIVQREGWELPLEAASTQSSVGGTLALAWSGASWLRSGFPKHCVLGLDLVLADGGAVRCGGRVVKNVTGYDLNKLYVGSCGSLGVMTRSWLRLRPKAEAAISFLVAAEDGLESLALALARRPTVASVMGMDRALVARFSPELATADAVLGVGFAGDVENIEADTSWLRGMASIQEMDATAAGRMRSARSTGCAADRVRVRFAASNSKLCSLRKALHALDAEVLICPGVGATLLWAWIPIPMHAASAAQTMRMLWQKCCDLAQQTSAAVFLEEVPAANAVVCKREIDVYGDKIPNLDLMHELKRKLDPHLLLNPGRGMGKL